MPDGRHFLYLVTTEQQEESEVYLASLNGKETKHLLTAGSNAIYAASAAGAGYLLFARQGALLAQPFDAGNLMLTGEPFRVADQVMVDGDSRGYFSVSDNGTLIYDPRGNLDNEQLAWFDRAGKLLGPIGVRGSFAVVSLSPDGKRVSVGSQDPRHLPPFAVGPSGSRARLDTAVHQLFRRRTLPAWHHLLKTVHLASFPCCGPSKNVIWAAQKQSRSVQLQ